MQCFWCSNGAGGEGVEDEAKLEGGCWCAKRAERYPLVLYKKLQQILITYCGSSFGIRFDIPQQPLPNELYRKCSIRIVRYRKLSGNRTRDPSINTRSAPLCDELFHSYGSWWTLSSLRSELSGLEQINYPYGSYPLYHSTSYCTRSVSNISMVYKLTSIQCTRIPVVWLLFLFMLPYRNWHCLKHGFRHVPFNNIYFN